MVGKWPEDVLAAATTAGLELELAPEPVLGRGLAFSSTFGIAAERTFAAAECRSAAAACSLDYQKSFEVDERPRL